MTIPQILDGVVTFLNASTPLTSASLTAVRTYQPFPDLSVGAIDTIQIYVAPQRDDIKQLARDTNREMPAINIAVIKHLNAATDPTAPGANAEIDGLINFAQSVALLFVPGVYLGSGTGTSWFETEWPLIFDPEFLKTRIFFSALRVTFKQTNPNP